MNMISTLSVTGPDALQFLQGQLTNDIRRVETEDEILAAWCNPKGRVICLMTVRRIESGFACSVPTELADQVVQRLGMFRFRSKVEFTLEPGKPVAAADAIARGIPWIGVAQSEKFTPHMLNLDLLDAISLGKGCYTGQEVVARTHYKGATRRRTLRFSSERQVSVADKVSLDGRDVGEVLNVAGSELLAVVPLGAADAALAVGDIPLRRLPLPYTV